MIVPAVPSQGRSGAVRPLQRDGAGGSDYAFLAELARALLTRRSPVAGRSTVGSPAGANVPVAVLPFAVPVPPVSQPAEVPSPGALAPVDRPAPAAPSISALAKLPPAASERGAASLADYPRPVGDTGRGFHWIPTLHTSRSAVDHFVQQAREMGASWVVFLNDGSQIGQNDYLVKQLVANHIEPVMRIYTPRGERISGDLTGMVRHYVGLGVHYFLPYNEPNLPEENPDGRVSVASYVDRWVPAAQAIVAGGGLPGIGALAPGAPVDDVGFLRATLDSLKSRGEAGLLDRGWIAVHNYTFNRPVTYQSDSNGFLKFRWYEQVAQDELGRAIPVISTEGGPRLGDRLDQRYPAVDEARRDELGTQAFGYLPHREPYFFAQSLWVLANEAGGGQDPAWSADALFDPTGAPTPLAQALRRQEENS